MPIACRPPRPNGTSTGSPGWTAPRLRRHEVAVRARPGSGGRIDRDLDHGLARRPGDGLELEHRVRLRQVIRIRRSALRRFSCSMMASISAAVRSTSPVSLTTTRS